MRADVEGLAVDTGALAPLRAGDETKGALVGSTPGGEVGCFKDMKISTRNSS
jgi:hypothetical protein